MPPEIEFTETIEKLGRGFEEFKKANNERLDQIEKKKPVDPLLEEKVNKMTQDLVQLTEMKQKLDQMHLALNRPGAEGSAGQKDNAEAEKKAWKSAWNKFLRKGEEKLTEVERKALTAQSDAEGGLLIRPEYATEVIQKIFLASPMRQVADVIQVGSSSIQFLTDSGDFESGWVGEIDARPETGTSTVAVQSIVVQEMYAKPYVSQGMIDDAWFDVEGYVNDKIAQSFAHKEGDAFINGTGTGQPKGLLQYAAGTGAGQIERITTTTAGVIDADQVVAWVFSLKAYDQADAKILLHPSAIGAIMKLRSGTAGGFLWQPNFQAGRPSQLLGKDIFLDDHFATVGAGAQVGAIGNFKRGYKIVDRIGIRMLRDPYTAKPYVAFYATKRVGGGALFPEAIKILTVHA